MKNLFTLLCMSLLITAGFAQEAATRVLRADQVNLEVHHALPPITEKIANPPSTQTQRTAPSIPNGTVMTDAVTSMKIGEASNAFTFIQPKNNQVVTAPGVGTNGGSVAFLYLRTQENSNST